MYPDLSPGWIQRPCAITVCVDFVLLPNCYWRAEKPICSWFILRKEFHRWISEDCVPALVIFTKVYDAPTK